MAFAGVALAQPNGYTGDGSQVRGQNRADDGRGGSQYRQGNRQDNHARGHGERGAGPDHNFYRGGRLLPEYRNHQYVVNDWRDHHLSAPPRGYQWVQTGGDYVLVAIATGIIAQILLGQ
ncbi:MAG: RcnB family protein [Rhodanobacter sp.]